ncbi:MAG: PadR family transcriptional regulator [Sedimentisphaerales bacterium]|nr:PadR family transcriptional regulator [Sedimentisphaerales bacterium]
MDFNNWKAQFRRGLLEMVTLNILQDGKIHGYKIVQKLKRLEGLEIREGNIYRILVRLRVDGLVKSSEAGTQGGPPRIYFELTKEGRKVIEKMNEHWDAVKKSIDAI